MVGENRAEFAPSGGASSPGADGPEADGPEADGPDPDAPQRGRLYQRLHSNPVLALTTKIGVAVAGTAVFVVGVIMIVTPGPAFVLIPLGLAILATEFDWARRALEKAREQARKAKERSVALDPKVRRRRAALTTAAVVLLVAAVATYVAVYDWPGLAVQGWDAVQSRAGWLPELPGM